MGQSLEVISGEDPRPINPIKIAPWFGLLTVQERDARFPVRVYILQTNVMFTSF